MSSVQERSFFKTTAGVATGAAGVITAVVGLLTAGTQLGWWGSDGGGNGTDGGGPKGGTATTAAVSTAAVPQFSAQPSSVSFGVLDPREKLVTVRNDSNSVPINWRPPSISGPDRAMFAATDVSCGARLEPGRTCDVRVRFAPARSGDFTGRLVLQPESGPAREVDLLGKAVL